MEKHHRVTACLSTEVLRNSEDFPSHGDAEGSAQGTEKFSQPFFFFSFFFLIPQKGKTKGLMS